MACRYYDDIIIAKLQKWVPEASNLRILKPDETKRLYELIANDEADAPFKLPFIALSRNTDIKLVSNIKSSKSFDGLKLRDESGITIGGENKTLQFNVLPIELNYQLDIYTKTYDEGDELLRNFLFKLINNPSMKISIPYNGAEIEHIAYIRVLDSVSDTSDITERIFSGQFTRWTIQFEVQDAFLFSVPYRKNWKLYTDPNQINSLIELSDNINKTGEQEIIEARFIK